MYELSLNILDIVQNSISAKASLILIYVELDTIKDSMKILIEDNGTGMSEAQMQKAADPFYTTRTTRSVGLGLSYFEMVSEMCNGAFHLSSELGKGTTVEATFQLSHVDRMPLGNMGQTLALLAGSNPDIEFVYQLNRDADIFEFDTREIKDLLDGVSINTPDVIVYMESYINENSEKIIGGIQL